MYHVGVSKHYIVGELVTCIMWGVKALHSWRTCNMHSLDEGSLLNADGFWPTSNFQKLIFSLLRPK